MRKKLKGMRLAVRGSGLRGGGQGRWDLRDGEGSGPSSRERNQQGKGDGGVQDW